MNPNRQPFSISTLSKVGPLLFPPRIMRVKSAVLCWTVMTSSASALLMSELPTPSIVFDMQALQRYIDSATNEESSLIPPLALSNDRGMLYPRLSDEDGRDLQAPPLKVCDVQSKEAFCYFHSSVVQSREQALEGKDDPVTTFLAELDLTPSVCGRGAELVLGLNNHHVGSYYWARSAGSGASMEAPGIVFDVSDGDRGILRWEKEGGPIECNSNDGKRSEWVNFLRPRDTVQLLPFNVDEAIIEADRIFGVSSKDRPLGSEPAVVCEWQLRIPLNHKAAS